MSKVIIFDWSGTISDDRLPVYEANMMLLEKYGKKRIKFDNWLENSKSNAAEFLKSYNIGIDVSTALLEHKRVFSEVLSLGKTPKIYRNARKVTNTLIKLGFHLAVVSSHPSENLKKEAKEYGIYDLFHSMIGDVKDKTATIKGHCQQMKSASKVYYIGDTIYDIQAAKEAGVKSIAITHGYHTKDKLLQEKPDIIINSLDELLSISK